MDIEIIDTPIRFRLHGLSAHVDDDCYGEVGCRLMDDIWKVVEGANLNTTGINHWVYLDDDLMFVGVEVRDAETTMVPKRLEPCEFELARYSRHVHIGPYHELSEKWQSLRTELSRRGETVTMPSLEVYGHSCEGDDEAKPETTILMGLA